MRAEARGGLERFCSAGKGRGLRALRPFHVGDLLFSCPAYACVLTVGERGHHCECCFARKEGLSKCGRCKQAFYCDVECQKEDWPLHKLECSSMVVLGENWNPSETVRLTARILAKQKIHPERTPSEKLLAVREFESHLDKLDNEKKDLIQSDIAALHQFYSKYLEFPDHSSLVVLFAQVNCNGFTIEDEELSHLGSAIFPDVALMNHSCCPNVIVTYKGSSLLRQSVTGYPQKSPQARVRNKHYPVYSLNVASMWLKLGRLYMGLENKAAGEKALKKAIAIMEVAHGKDHPYISEIKQEIESH